MSDCRLYLISPSDFDLETFKGQLTSALDGGDVACFQLRMKDAADAQIIEAANALMPICHAKDVALLINDRVDIAKEVGADGVHLGQSDGSVKEARSELGHDASIGVTCHDSRDLGYKAGSEGADYAAFGAFYDTDTKDTEHRPEPEILTLWAAATELPSVAIGGITPQNAKPLVEAGADFIAVCSYVWNHKDGPKAAVAEFEALLAG